MEAPVRIEGIKTWRETMSASIDLLVAVEQADEVLIPDEVAEKAAALRAVFDRLLQ
jgi:hypothetical protein